MPRPVKAFRSQVEPEPVAPVPTIGTESGGRLFGVLAPHLGRVRTRLIAALAAAAVSAALGLAFPFLSGRLIDHVIGPKATLPGPGEPGLYQLSLLLGGSVLLQAVAAFAGALLFHSAGQAVVAGLRRDCFARVVSLPMSFFGRRRVGELTSRISSDIAQVENLLVDALPQMCRQALFLAGGVALMAATSLRLTAAMLVAVPPMIAAAVFFGWRLRQRSRETQDHAAASNVVAEEALHGIASVKAFANETLEIARYEVANDRVRRAAWAAGWWQGLFGAFFVVAVFGTMVVVLGSGAALLQAGAISAGQLTRFILYATFVAGAMGQAADLYGRGQKARGAAARIRELLDEPPEITVADEAATAATRLPGALRGEVVFDRVSFSYPSRPDARVLDDLTLAAAAGERIALVGPSGAGKSTLTALLFRFYEPDSGRVLIDGREARAYPRAWLRRRMAIVPQDILLFGGSVAENIRYARPDATDDEIRDAARRANADAFIRGFPDGYATQVGERGLTLSGGQRQRIAIARAMLRHPAILILDEATSSLDSENEQLVQAALDRLMEGRTTFVIAHRLATVRNSDRIVVLEKGRVVETGPWRELEQTPGGVFRRLSQLQCGAFELAP